MSILKLTVDYIKEYMVDSDYRVSNSAESIDRSFADNVIEYIISLTKTPNSALVQLTGLRKLLTSTNNPKYIDLAGYILQSPVYVDLMKEARELANDSLVNGSNKKEHITDIGLSKLGDYKDVLLNLNTAIKELKSGKRDVNIYDLLYAIINFSARPTDILNMEFEIDRDSGDYYLKYWGKQRGDAAKDSRAPYIGYLHPNDAKYLLDKVHEYYKRAGVNLGVNKGVNKGVNNDDINNDIRRVDDQLRRASKALFGVNPRDLRRISSIILSSTEPNRIKRIQKQQAILRHKSPLTSVMYYN